MRIGHTALGALAGVALLAGSIVPAEARGRQWDGGYGGWGGYGHRHHDDFDFGDAVGIAALIGAVAIVAGSMSKDRKARDGTEGSRDVTPSGADSRDSSDYSTDYAPTGGNPAGGNALADENSAVDACAVAARDEASADGGYAEIRDIGAPKPVGGGWDVDGRVERRSAYRDQSGDVRRFTCSVRDGRVSEVYLSKDITA